MMVCLNELAKLETIPQEAAEKFTLLLAPFAPHLAEELWENLGHKESIAYEKFPEYDEKVLQVSEVEILVQVLGRPKARLMMPVDCDADTAKAIALADETVKEAMGGKEPRKVIYVQNRLVNIVI